MAAAGGTAPRSRGRGTGRGGSEGTGTPSPLPARPYTGGAAARHATARLSQNPASNVVVRFIRQPRPFILGGPNARRPVMTAVSERLVYVVAAAASAEHAMLARGDRRRSECSRDHQLGCRARRMASRPSVRAAGPGCKPPGAHEPLDGRVSLQPPNGPIGLELPVRYCHDPALVVRDPPHLPVSQVRDRDPAGRP